LADLAGLLHKPEAQSLLQDLPALKSRMETAF
jgi:hypothetical protein